MGSHRLPSRLVALLAAVSALGALTAPAVARGPVEQRIDASVRYLQAVQNADGGFGGRATAESDPIFTSWAALALAAAGINPRDQALPGGRSAVGYLRATVSQLSRTTDFERTLMVATASGSDPRDFAGVDLVAPVLERQRPDGSFPQAAGGAPTVNATAFAVISLAQVGDPSLEGPIQRAATWLESAHDPVSGGWSWAPGAAGDSDMTAAVIQALRAAGRGDTEAERRGLAYLRTLQNDDGGFSMLPGGESNSPSTAWTLQALWAARENPRRWAREGGTPLDYLASMQQGDGSVRQSASSDPNRVWVTAYAVPALAGRPLPIEFVPRAPVAPESSERQPAGEARGPTPDALPDDPAAASGGQPGAADEPANGAIYGGTGAGAPLYSAPRADGGATRNASSTAQGGSGRGGGVSRGRGSGVGGLPAPEPASSGASTGEVEGTIVSDAGPGAAPVDATRLSTAGGGGGDAGALLLLGGVCLVAIGGACVERRA